MKTFLEILAIQVITVFVIIFIFKTVNDNKLAGLVGGLVFLTTSALNIYLLFKFNQKKSFVFYTTVLFVILFVMPMLLSRLFYYELSFEQIKILGFSAKTFHYWSEKFYLILLLSTLADIIRLRFFASKAAQ